MQQLDAEEQNRQLQKGAKAFLLRKLSLRNHHSNELIKALKEREVPQEIISQLIQEFTELGYIDDALWIETKVRQWMRQKYGPESITQKLRAYKIPESQIIKTINLLYKDDAKNANIQKLITTRYRSKDLKNPAERKKVIAALLRKGFDLQNIFDEIKKAVMLLYI